jgi:hypothetical protein
MLTNTEGFVTFKNEQIAFADRQAVYYNTLKDAILINPGINYDALTQSTQQPATLITTSKPSTQKERIATDPHNSFTDADEKFCTRVKSPALFPARPANATKACGWWFMPDLNRASVGMLGTRNGPLFKEKLPAGGEWIWDIRLATKKEEIKRCKKIRNCSLLKSKAIQSECGYCPNLGHGIPIKPNGDEKYPEDIQCGTKLIETADKCPGPPAPPVVTSEGISCGTYGKPSEDNYIRVYTAAECKALDSTAVHIPNGECLKAAGGSYSWDCRNLNGPIVRVEGICNPDGKGRLSRACLLSLCKGMGYSSGGTIVRLLTDSKAEANELDKLAMEMLKTIGITVPTALLGAGDIDESSAIDMYQTLVSLTYGNVAELYREAAKRLVYGGDNFDPCDLPDDTRGPFLPRCIAREGRKAGLQMAGWLKNTENYSYYNDKTWGQVKRELKLLYDQMMRPGYTGEEQDRFVKNVLGITISREEEKPCASDYYIYGKWMPRDLPVQVIKTLSSGELVYIAQDGVYTKMVPKSGGAKYYVGPVSDFNPINWNYYAPVGGNYVLGKSKPNPSDFIMYGPWMGKEVKIQLVQTLVDSGEFVYITQDGIYTKMVSHSGVAKYYVGSVSEFYTHNWHSYTSAGSNYIIRKVK